MYPLVEVGTGFSSTVYRTSDDRCLKAANDAEAAVRNRREAGLLGVIAGHVGVEVPWPAQELPPSRLWPHGAVLCPWLSGGQLGPGESPASVARFVRDLATVPAGSVAGLAVPYPRWRDRQRQTVADGLAAVAPQVASDVVEWLRWFAGALEDLLPQVDSPSLIHGDLWSENMLARSGVLTGVLDWEFAAIADPAADLAGLWYLGQTWVDALVAELSWPPQVIHRAHFQRVVRELYGVAWSVRHDDRKELAESARKTTDVVRAVRAATRTER